jgi:transposase
VAVVDAAGRTVERFTVTHTSAGLRELVRRLGRHQVGEVAIERCDGQVVETLLAAGVAGVVISANQLKNLRSRYVLADTLRTDRLRLRALTPDGPATVTLRAAVRARKDLVSHRVALCNQLRAHLKRSTPPRWGCSTSWTG